MAGPQKGKYGPRDFLRIARRAGCKIRINRHAVIHLPGQKRPVVFSAADRDTDMDKVAKRFREAGLIE